MNPEDTSADTLEASSFDSSTNKHATEILPAGTCVGRFVILNQLGRGGMGVVYKAYDPELDRRIAIKLLTVQPLEGEPLSTPRDRLVREAQALAKLNHPNVVAVYDVGVFRTGVYVAMEFVEGKTLRAWLKEEKRSVQEILQVFIAAGQGLQAAHERGMIHRDFKPDNVMVGEKGRVWILDFGLAKATASETERTETKNVSPLEIPSDAARLDVNITRANGLVGTAVYMAPEQIFNAGVSEQSDQFSFCVSLYEALFGKRPFARKNLDRIAVSVMKDEVTIPENADIPAYLGQILIRGLSRDPQDRFPSIEELLQNLKHDPEEIATNRRKTRNRKLLVCALILLSVSLPIGVWYGMRYRTLQLCKAAEREFHGVWDSKSKSRVKNAFLATKETYARGTWKRVQKTIDRYQADWTRMRNDVCEARHIRGTQSEELFDLRMSCLKTRKRELEALMKIFVSADSKILPKAVQASSSLTSINICADEKALRLPYPPPKIGEQSKQVEAIHAKLAEVEALQMAGRYNEGLVLALKADDRANNTTYPPIKAKAKYWLGRMFEGVGDYKAAETTLLEATKVAGMCRDSMLVAKAMVNLVLVVGYKQARHEAGLLMGRDAQLIIDIAGGNRIVRSSIYNNLGIIYRNKGDYDKSLEYYRQSLLIREKEFGPDHPIVASSLNNIGIVYHYKGEYDKAFEYYSKTLALEEKSLGPRHPHVAMSLNNLGAVLKERGKCKQALDYYQRSLLIKEKVLGATHPSVALTLSGIGEVYSELGDYDMALDYLRRALSIRERALGSEHPILAWTLSSIGDIFVKRKQYQYAHEPLERVIELCKKANCDNAPLGNALYDLGQTKLASQGNIRKAIALVRQSKTVFSSTPNRFRGELIEVAAWLNKHDRGKSPNPP